MKLEIGDLAPSFTLSDSFDKKISLEDFKGKWVVLYFYPKDDTPGCTLEAMTFSKDHDKFKELGASVVGISKDNTGSHINFISKYRLTIDLLSDKNHKVIEKYGAWSKKKLFNNVYYGIQRSTFLIDKEGKIAFIWPKVKVLGHSKKVLDKIKELSKKKDKK